MPSIEILVEKFSESSADIFGEYSFAVKITNPPVSDSSPSLWQQRFESIGGTLVHLGEPRFKEKKADWFFAYELLDVSQPESFRFKQKYLDQVLALLTSLLGRSKSHTIHFTSDWQFGPKSAQMEKRTLTIDEFIKIHNAPGLRFNTWFTIHGKNDAEDSNPKGQK